MTDSYRELQRQTETGRNRGEIHTARDKLRDSHREIHIEAEGDIESARLLPFRARLMSYRQRERYNQQQPAAESKLQRMT